MTVSTRIPILHPIPLKINSTQIEVHMQCEERQSYPPLMMVSTLILSLPQAQSQLQLTQVFQELQELLVQQLKVELYQVHSLGTQGILEV